MRKADAIVAGVLVILGLFTLTVVIPTQTPPGEGYGMPPAFFPSFSIGLVVIFSVILFVQSVSASKKAKDDPPPLTCKEWRALAGVSGLLLLGLIIISLAGYIVGGIVIVASFMLYMGEKKPWRIALVSLPGPALIYYAVWKILSIPLP